VTRRNAVFVIASVAMATLFVRLGIWQLHRLTDRRARNALVESRLAAAPIPLAAVPRDTVQLHFLPVRIAGTYDFEHEIVLIDRIRDGAPGVHLLTPLRPDTSVGGDTMVLVDRGWLYAPDGMSVDEGRSRESSHVDGTGYLITLEAGRGPASIGAARLNRLRWLDRGAIARRVGHPVANYAVVLETVARQPAGPDALASGTTSAALTRVPERVPRPSLDEGPHLSYAIQWFAFALIAVVGPIFAVVMRPTGHNLDTGT
jgi:surfeit locus 1 family protein